MIPYRELNKQRGKGVYLRTKCNVGFKGIISDLDQEVVTFTCLTKSGDYDGMAVIPIERLSYMLYDDPEINKIAVEYMACVSEGVT